MVDYFIKQSYLKGPGTSLIKQKHIFLDLNNEIYGKDIPSVDKLKSFVPDSVSASLAPCVIAFNHVCFMQVYFYKSHF